MPGAAAAVQMGAVTAWCGSLEGSTGFLMGPRHGSRALYLETSSGAAWQKTCSAAKIRKMEQGRPMGADLAPTQDPSNQTAMPAASVHGLQLVHLAFPSSDGALRPPETGRLHALLNAASDWSTPGRHFDHLAPQNPEGIAIFALPIVIAAGDRFAGNSRPVLEKSPHGCAAALDRFSGCLLDREASGGHYPQLAPIVLKPVLNSSKP